MRNCGLKSAIALVLLLPLLASARDTTSWANVTALPAGKAVEVTRRTGDPVKGELTSTTADSITVRGTTIPRAEVTKVGAKGGGRAKWIGLAIGAAGGLVIGLAGGERLANESAGDIDIKAVAGGAGAAIGGLIGFGIGAGTDRGYKTIYKAP